MNELGQRPDDGRVDAVLAAIRGTQPEAGLEARLLRRLAAHPVPASRPAWMPGFASQPGLAARLALVAAVVALGAGVLVHFVTRSAPSPARELASATGARRVNESLRSSSAMAKSALHPAGEVLAVNPVHALSARRDAIATQGGDGSEARVVGDDAEARSRSGSAREPSYPAPAMPLTEQERLLLQIAQRNDPVQVAMLDPVERNFAHARDRAETLQFFKPEPLPPDLQEQVKAALRSQYVNTPPPSDLLASNADRSTP